MKTLNRFIIEKLKLGKNVQINNYHFYPNDFNDLRSLLEQLLNERGKDADLNDIDVSKVTTFYDIDKKIGLFEDLDPHNIDISEWDVRNVEKMVCMFWGCKKFKGDGLENWKPIKCQNMWHMFHNCENFTGKGLENWKVDNVKDMSYMFYGCKIFNCDLSNWDVSNVIDMMHMFNGCSKFIGSGLENWNVDNVKDMRYMFHRCTSLKNKPSWYKE